MVGRIVLQTLAFFGDVFGDVFDGVFDDVFDAW